MSTFTVSKNLEQVARGADLGTWDTPENSNWAIVDAALGGTTTIPLNNSNVLLSSPQFQSNLITFNSTLTGSVVITFPSTFTGTYVIQNLCTGTSAFTITLATTVAGGQVIGCKPGEPFDVLSDGTNLKFYNLDHIGRYWDYAGSSVPNWVSACTVAPYLNCDGTTFSSVTYPALAVILGSTTLPDSRGRSRHTLNQGTARLTAAGAGIDGNTNFAVGGNNGITLASSNIPTIASAGSNSITVNANNSGVNLAATTGSVAASGGATGVAAASPSASNNVWTNLAAISGTNTINVTYTNASLTGLLNAAPGYVGGITMIRSA